MTQPTTNQVARIDYALSTTGAATGRGGTAVSVDAEALQALQIVTRRYRQGREPFRRLCLDLAEALEIEVGDDPAPERHDQIRVARIIEALRAVSG